MKKKLQNLLRGIALTSLSSLTNAYGAQAIPDYTVAKENNDDDSPLNLENQNNQTLKMLLHFNDDGDYMLMGHRSHSSHSSHSSHRSGSSHASHYSHSSHSSSSTHYSASTHYSSAVTTTASSSPRVYSLGDRTIRQYTTGNDVKELSTLLVKHGYINSSDVDKSYSGDVRCGLKMTNAIKAFQKDAKLQTDGIAGPGTIRALKEWTATDYSLGDRVLKRGMEGMDVSQLKNLLIEKGFMKGDISLSPTLSGSLMENVIITKGGRD